MDVSEDHGCYQAYSAGEVVVLEEDGEGEQGEEEDGYEDGEEGVGGIFIERDDEVGVLAVVGFCFLLLFLLALVLFHLPEDLVCHL